MRRLGGTHGSNRQRCSCETQEASSVPETCSQGSSEGSLRAVEEGRSEHQEQAGEVEGEGSSQEDRSNSPSPRWCLRELWLQALQPDHPEPSDASSAPQSGSVTSMGLPRGGPKCGCSSVVERFLAKEEAEGSTPFTRSVVVMSK